MINVSITKQTGADGETIFRLSPVAIVIGNKDANIVDTIQFDGIPDEWAGLTIRATFVPLMPTITPTAVLLDANYRVPVYASISGSRGSLVVDAFSGDGYHAYTDNCRYSAVPHEDIGSGQDPEYTPSQIEQILSQAQTYANSAIDARDAAQDAAENAQGYAGDAQQSAEDAAQSAAEIEEMTVSAQTLPAGSAATVTKTETPTGINLDFGIPKGDAGNVQDVTLNGSSIVTDGVAVVPTADSNGNLGVVKGVSGFGAFVSNSGVIVLSKATDAQIDGRTEQYKPIVPNNLDYAVKAAMTDGRGAAWTAAEQLAGRERLGLHDFADFEQVATATIPAQTIITKIDLSKPCRFLVVLLTFQEDNANSLNVYTGHCYNGVLNNVYRTTGTNMGATDRVFISIMIPAGTNAFCINGRNATNIISLTRLQQSFPTAVDVYDNVMIHFYDHNRQTSPADVVVWGM